MANPITHASQSTLANVVKPSSSLLESSDSQHGFAALLEASQVGGASPMMQTEAMDPSLSLYLQGLEQSVQAAAKERHDTNEIDVKPSGVVGDVNTSIWTIS